jgi:hypothetical protein
VENIRLKRDKTEFRQEIALMADIGERLRRGVTGKGMIDGVFD